MNHRRKARRLDGEKIFSIIASLAIVIALVVGVISIIKSTTSGKNKNYINLNLAEEESTQGETETSNKTAQAETGDATAQTPSSTREVVRETASETPKEVEETQAQTEAENEPAAVDENDAAVSVNAVTYHFSESDSLLWPVNGDIILGYNMDNTIYFPTLDVYRCNPAVIIGADEGTPVYSAASGIVDQIFEDRETGTTMVISIGDGYELTYGQLEALSVAVGDHVAVGTQLAQIAQPTKYFTMEGSNLYFKLTLDGEPVDPLLFLIEE